MGVHRAVSAGRVEIDALTRRVRERGGYRRLLSSFCAGHRWSVQPHRCHRGILKGEGEAGEMEAQQAGNYPQCEPVRRFSRPYDGGNVFPLGR